MFQSSWQGLKASVLWRRARGSSHLSSVSVVCLRFFFFHFRARVLILRMIWRTVELDRAAVLTRVQAGARR